jgi:aryl-alcohol dehydrogenase-like predicted oxidoreductase
MDTRRLGSQGLTVSEIGLGCMGMSEFYGTGDEDESIATIHRALDLGVNFIDTADMYGPFTNEKLVGKAIKDRRDEVVLATKFGNERTEDGGMVGVNGSPDYVWKAADASLKRLGLDHIEQLADRVAHVRGCRAWAFTRRISGRGLWTRSRGAFPGGMWFGPSPSRSRRSNDG